MSSRLHRQSPPYWLLLPDLGRWRLVAEARIDLHCVVAGPALHGISTAGTHHRLAFRTR